MNKKDYSSLEKAIQAVIKKRSVLTCLIAQAKSATIKGFCKQIHMSTGTFYRISHCKFVTDVSWFKLLTKSCQVLTKEEFLKYINDYFSLFYEAFSDK